MIRRLRGTDQFNRRIQRDLIVIAGAAIAVTALSFWYDLFDRLYEYSRAHEDYEIDEFLTIGFVASIALVVFSWRRVKDQRREIVARRQAEERAHLLANADALTGLPNRRRLESEMDAALANVKPNRKRAFMLIDLNRFKPINDVYGHQAGDDVLVDVAHRLSATVDRESLVFRLGGDEFAVLTGEISDVEPAGRMARRIVAAMDIPFAASEASLTVGLGIGIAVAPDDATTTSELLRKSDVALYRAKSKRLSGYHFFEPEMDRVIMRRSQLEADMRTAMSDGSIHPNFQPIVRLGDRQIIGFEALARWTHPKFGDISPTEFIAIAEDCGMMPKLSEHLLRQACAAAVTWPSELIVSINISPTELGDQTLVLRILKALGDTGLPANRLEIEIAERALVGDYEMAHLTLKTLQDAGIRLALDDFGAGNSSLQHLRELRFERLKIHRTFIAQMATSPEVEAMIQAILHIATALNLKTTAEGIEKSSQIAPLLAEGCAEAQGFHFGAAVPAADVQALLDAPQIRAVS